MISTKSYSLILIIFALITSLVIPTSYARVKQQHKQPKTYILSGKVINAQTGEVISNIKITIIDSDRSVTTDEEGSFTFTGLPRGQYAVKIEAEGYKTWKKQLNISDDSELTIGLEPSI